MSQPMMKCGHAANAVNGLGKPVCVLCIGLGIGCNEIDHTFEVSKNREAICCYKYGSCEIHGKKPSSTDLAFFESKPDKEFDEYYCGCHGWD